MLCGFVSALSAEPLEEISRLSKSGAAELALSILDHSQPEFESDRAQWQRWERMRVRILEQRGQWQALAERLASHPEGLDESFRRWSQERRAHALLLAGEPAEARQLLRRLLWQSDAPSRAELIQWRQLVMQSYLQQSRIDDAYLALLRYQQDYGEAGEEALLLRVRILLASDHAAEARLLLDGVNRDELAEQLWMLAGLRSGVAPGTVLAQRYSREEAEQLSSLAQYLHFGVIAEAAGLAGDHAAAVLALEQWYRLPAPIEQWGELFNFGAERLWQAYLDYATQVGNRRQLLIGNDVAWLELAEQTEARYPVRKRSIHAFLSQRGSSSGVRAQAAVALAESLQQHEDGMAVVKQLFLHGERYADAAAIPAGVAYLLVDLAIREGQLTLASKLLQQLPEPPDNGARFPWQLRRGKVFILAGDYASAEKLLMEMIPLAITLGQGPRDHLMQLLFDLQAVGEHQRAYGLLQALYSQVPDLKLRRELLFWMADSMQAQQEFIAASRLYLLSATLIDVKSMDPWAQTARYKAAQSLADAGMLADAAHLYSELLRVTEQPERRAVLRRELEQVRMRQAAGASG